MKYAFAARRHAGLLAATPVLAACADEPTVPMGGGDEVIGDAPALATLLTCAVDVRAGSMACEPSSPSGVVGGPDMNLIVGSQHRFVRMGNDVPLVSGDVWSANVTVQNLTLQPFGTLDGNTAHPSGVRVFFVDEPSNGVEVVSHDDEAVFTGSGTQKYFEYGSLDLGADGILTPGEVSEAKAWVFELNGAATFQFSVLVSTEVPDPDAIGVHLTRVSASGEHACGDGADGKVYCWGYNHFGQLGDGTETHRLTPVAVKAPDGVRLSRVSAGSYHTCAEGDDQNIYCWGNGTGGQLGNGAQGNSSTPVAVDVSGLPAGVELSGVSAGNGHTCAVGSNGSVYCWGHGAYGQLGNGEDSFSTVPDSVKAPEDVTFTRVSAGGIHTCAEGTDARLYCWGYNNDGQLGTGRGNSNVPETVAAPAGVKFSRVTTGMDHTCAEGTDGDGTKRLYCWGDNGYGQLGNSTAGGSSPLPVPVNTGESALVGVTAGSRFTCAEDLNGSIYCWGNGSSGQLGNGAQTGSSAPVAVHAPAGVELSGVTAGNSFACAVSPDGAFCWGRNLFGRLGDGTQTNRRTPGLVAGTKGR